MVHDVQAAISIGILLSFLLGPVFFVLLETAVIKGFRAALALDMGVIFSDVVFIIIAYLGTNQLLQRIKDNPALFVLGGCLLLGYGCVSLVKERRNYSKRRNISVELINKNSYFKLFIKGFLLNFINIGVLGFWFTVIIAVGPQLDMDQERIVAFFATILLSYLAIDMVKIILAKRLKQKLTPNRIYIMKLATGMILVIFGCILIAQGVFKEELVLIRTELDTQ